MVSARQDETQCSLTAPPKCFYVFYDSLIGIFRPKITIGGMQLARIGMRILGFLFFSGLIGSAIVVLLSFVEDARELFGEE